MKKILIAVAIVAAAAGMTACGSKESAATEANEHALKTKIENCTNPDSLTVYVDQAKAYAQKLVQEGKVDEAKKYLDQLTPVVKDKAPALVSTLETVKTAIDKLPGAVADSTTTAAGEVVDSVKSKGEALKDAAVDKANDAVNSVKDAGGKAVEATKDATSKAADKANEAIQNVLGK